MQKNNQQHNSANICTLCQQAWQISSTDAHTIVCLSNCGHVFGKSCIANYIRTQLRCPTCHARAPANMIKHLFVNEHVGRAVIDTELAREHDNNLNMLKQRLAQKQQETQEMVQALKQVREQAKFQNRQEWMAFAEQALQNVRKKKQKQAQAIIDLS